MHIRGGWICRIDDKFRIEFPNPFPRAFVLRDGVWSGQMRKLPLAHTYQDSKTPRPHSLTRSRTHTLEKRVRDFV
jgi:hypothetical protein